MVSDNGQHTQSQMVLPLSFGKASCKKGLIYGRIRGSDTKFYKKFDSYLVSVENFGYTTVWDS